MPTPTYTPLANVTLGASANSVTFTSIPQTYRDLILVSNVQASAAFTIFARFNGEATTYSFVFARGTSAGAGSGSNASGFGAGLGAFTAGLPTTGITAVSVAQFMDYSATDKHKTVLSRYGNGSTEVDMAASRWADTAAITQIQILLVSPQTYSAGSTFALYGIAS